MKISGKFFVVYVKKTENWKSGVFRVSAGKKVSKKAVIRNKVKRLAREAARTIGIPDGKDITAVAIPESALKKFSEIKKDLENIFIKL